MTRVINLIELFAFVVLSGLSVVTLMFSRRDTSSSSAPDSPLRFFFQRQQPVRRSYELELLMRAQSTATRVYPESNIVLKVYDDITRLEYELIDSNGTVVFANSAQNTDIVFHLNKKMKIYAEDNDDVSYTLAFHYAYDAYLVTNYIISARSAQFKKCKGDNTLQLQKLYKYGAAGNLIDMGTDWCVFKIQKTNLTVFMMRFIALEEDYRNVTCVFREDDFHLTQLPNASNKFELEIFFGEEILDPTYVLKASPAKVQEFFEPA